MLTTNEKVLKPSAEKQRLRINEMVEQEMTKWEQVQMDALNHEMEVVATSVNFKREVIQCNELEET